MDRVEGYSMILDKEKLNINFFDENIFMYLENDDLCLRVKKENKKIFVHSKSFIDHLGAKTVDEKYFDELEYSRNWHWIWSKFYFNKKHYGFIKAFFSGYLMFVKSMTKYLFYLIINKIQKIYYLRAWLSECTFIKDLGLDQDWIDLIYSKIYLNKMGKSKKKLF